MGKPTFTYFVQAAGGGNIKIGRAIDPERRLGELQCGSPVKLVLLGSLKGDREAELHSRFSESRAHGEWFTPSPALSDFLAKQFAVGADEPPHPAELDDWVRDEAVRKYAGKRIDRDEFDKWADQRWRTLGNCKVVDSEDDDDEPLCECEACSFHRAAGTLESVEFLGVIWRSKDDMLCVFYESPRTPLDRMQVTTDLLDAFGDFDAACVSLNAIAYTASGGWRDQHLFGRWCGNSLEECERQYAARASAPASPVPHVRGGEGREA